jgi:hypothetical protein
MMVGFAQFFPDLNIVVLPAEGLFKMVDGVVIVTLPDVIRCFVVMNHGNETETQRIKNNDKAEEYQDRDEVMSMHIAPPRQLHGKTFAKTSF